LRGRASGPAFRATARRPCRCVGLRPSRGLGTPSLHPGWWNRGSAAGGYSGLVEARGRTVQLQPFVPETRGASEARSQLVRAGRAANCCNSPRDGEPNTSTSLTLRAVCIKPVLTPTWVDLAVPFVGFFLLSFGLRSCVVCCGTSAAFAALSSAVDLSWVRGLMVR
jgi:hypothetical protein